MSLRTVLGCLHIPVTRVPEDSLWTSHNDPRMCIHSSYPFFRRLPLDVPGQSWDVHTFKHRYFILCNMDWKRNNTKMVTSVLWTWLKSVTIYGSVDEFMGVHKSLLHFPQVKKLHLGILGLCSFRSMLLFHAKEQNFVLIWPSKQGHLLNTHQYNQ